MSIRDRINKGKGGEGSPKPSPPPVVTETPPLAQRTFNGWKLMVVGKEMGVMISPEGKQMTMRHQGGISTVTDSVGYINAEVIDAMDTMLRSRTR